jgi:hypothetical protein
MIQFFRKDYILQYVALLMLQLFFWLPAFLNPELNQERFLTFTSPGHSFIIWLTGNNPRLLTAIGFLFVYFSALILNLAATNHSLVSKNSMVTAFIYVVLMSHRPIFLTLNPTLVASLFIIISIYQLFTLYIEKEAYSKVFNIGILLAIGSLFYFEVFMLLLFIWWAYNIYRIFFWREWVLPVLGFLTIYFFLGVFYFWTDQLSQALQQYQLLLQGLYSFNIGFNQDYFSLITQTAVFLLTIFAAINLILHLNEYIISVRKHYWISIILLLILLLINIFTGHPDSTNMVLLQIPMAIVISGFLTRVRRPFWLNVYLWVLMTLIIFHNYYVILSPLIFD